MRSKGTERVSVTLSPIVKEIRLLRNGRGSFDVFKTLMPGAIEHCNTRWLISCVDTYFDHGTDVEQSNAGMIISIMNMLRLAGTVRCDPAVLKRGRPLFDGVMCIQNVAHEDTFANYRVRLERCLQRTPELHDLYLRIRNNILKSENIITKYMTMTGMEIL